MKRFHLALGVWMLAISSLAAQEKKDDKNQLPAASVKTRDEIVAKAVNYLKTKGQAEDGTFSKQAGPGITALVLTGMLRNGAGLKDPNMERGMKALETFVKPDGGIYGNGRLKNYETCVAMLCFSEANKVAGDGRYNKILADAKAFVLTMQIVKGDDAEIGGVGYAGQGRPDLSNTAFLIDALRAADADENDPAIQRALAFVSHCQNLKSEFNDNEVAAKVNDGGFFYTIPSEKALESGDRNSPSGGLRSYGSMTYNGLKSMIYSGLKPDDKRVKAASQWIAKHYSLTENPGMGKAGLFYYYHTFGAALKAIGNPMTQGADGKEHAWQVELIDVLAKSQGSDGAWQNENKQWFEDDKNLATAFALMSLGYCRN